MIQITEEMLAFGLTRQESKIYLTLLAQGPLTGYETAKLTGISRSNTYTALAELVEHGAAVLLEENVSKYLAVNFEEFSSNIIRRLMKKQKKLLPLMPEKLAETGGYITLHGRQQIMDKLFSMLEQCEYRLYISVPYDILLEVKDSLAEQIFLKKRVVILADRPCSIEGATIYQTSMGESQIRLIVDSTKVLTGRISSTENSTCLFSQNRNLVDVFKEMLQNEIRLIELDQHGM